MTTNETVSMIAEIIESLLEDRDLLLDDDVGPETLLIADLGLASVDFVQIFVDIEQRCGTKIGFHDLIMPGGTYVDDLTVARIASFVHDRLTSETAVAPTSNASSAGIAVEPASSATEPAKNAADGSAPASSAVADADAVDRVVVDDSSVAAFTELMPKSLVHDQAPPAARNPKAIFLLAAPRTGSTLLRVLLAGSPRIFSPPELHLLNYPDMAVRRQALDNEQNRHLLSGTITAIARSKDCSAAEAEAIVEGFERDRLSTHDFYRYVQRLSPDRLLVDKTPIYGFYPDVLQRAEDAFDQPLFIHLVRHPGGMIRSFVDAKMEQLIPALRASSFSRREIAELVWIVTQRNIRQFLNGVPSERCHCVRYEDLVLNPEPTLRSLCGFCGVDFTSEMLEPYSEASHRMTDGHRGVSQYSGDLKFHLHSRIEPEMATRWKRYLDPRSISEAAVRLASELGIDPSLSAPEAMEAGS